MTRIFLAILGSMPELANQLAQQNYLKLIAANQMANKRENAFKTSTDKDESFSFLIEGLETPINLGIGTGSEYFIETDPNIF